MTPENRTSPFAWIDDVRHAWAETTVLGRWLTSSRGVGKDTDVFWTGLFVAVVSSLVVWLGLKAHIVPALVGGLAVCLPLVLREFRDLRVVWEKARRDFSSFANLSLFNFAVGFVVIRYLLLLAISPDKWPAFLFCTELLYPTLTWFSKRVQAKDWPQHWVPVLLSVVGCVLWGWAGILVLLSATVLIGVSVWGNRLFAGPIFLWGAALMFALNWSPVVSPWVVGG